MSESWPAPIAIDQVELPEFPVEALPGWLGEYVQALADETQTQVDLPAMLVLGVLAASVQRRYVAQIRPRYLETLSLWIVVVLASGERKSTVFKSALSPIFERQHELVRNGKAERARALAELASAEARLTKATREAGTKSGSDATVAICARDEAVEDVQRLQGGVPPEATLIVDDITPEKFGIVMADSGSLLIASPEGGALSNFFGRYNNGKANLDLLLKSHSGDAAAVERIGRDKLTIYDPALTMAMAVQPDVLLEAARQPEWSERGGMSRLLPAWPTSRVGTRTGSGSEMPQAVEDTYRRKILALLPSQPPTCRADHPAEPVVMRFDAAARGRWEAFYDTFERRLHPETGDLGWCAGWGGKFPGAIARIATLLQLAEGGAGEVGLEAIESALRIAPYLEAHALSALLQANERPGLKDARQLLAWLRREQPETFTEREAYRFNFGQDKQRAAAACSLLAERGWIRGTKGDRSDSTRWDVHPELLGVSAVSALSDIQDNSRFEVTTTTYGSIEPNGKNGAYEPSRNGHTPGTADTTDASAARGTADTTDTLDLAYLATLEPDTADLIPPDADPDVIPGEPEPIEVQP